MTPATHRATPIPIRRPESNPAFAARVAATYRANDPRPVRPVRPMATPKLTPRAVTSRTFVRPIAPMALVVYFFAAMGWACVVALALGLLNFAWNGF